MKPPVYALTEFKIRPDKIGMARKRMREVEKYARSKPGVLQFHFLQDMEDATVFTSYGIFASQRDLDSYFAAMTEKAATDPRMNELLDQEFTPAVRALDRI